MDSMRAEREGIKKGESPGMRRLQGFMPTAPTETQSNAPIAHRDVR
jgi:hypothetical protein